VLGVGWCTWILMGAWQVKNRNLAFYKKTYQYLRGYKGFEGGVHNANKGFSCQVQGAKSKAEIKKEKLSCSGSGTPARSRRQKKRKNSTSS